MKMFKNYLLENGVTSTQVISIDFDSVESEKLLNYKKLYEHIIDKLHPNKQTYIFLDEVQEVEDFQKVVNSLYLKSNVYI